MTPSTMKPTQFCCAEGSINQIPPWAEIKGQERKGGLSVNECETPKII